MGVWPIGWRDGRWARKRGVAGCTVRAAQGRAPVALLPPPSLLLPTIATQASPTGWRVGVHLRRIGVARMLARAADQQLEVVLERPVRGSVSGALEGAGAGAIFRRYSLHLIAVEFALWAFGQLDLEHSSS